MVEQRTENPCVDGSIPSRPTYPDLVQLVERLTEDQQEYTTRVQVRVLESGLICVGQLMVRPSALQADDDGSIPFQRFLYRTLVVTG